MSDGPLCAERFMQESISHGLSACGNGEAPPAYAGGALLMVCTEPERPLRIYTPGRMEPGSGIVVLGAAGSDSTGMVSQAVQISSAEAPPQLT